MAASLIDRMRLPALCLCRCRILKANTLLYFGGGHFGAVQANFLQGIFVHAKTVGREAVQGGAQDARIALEAIRLCCRVLEWDFRHVHLPSSIAASRVWEPTEVGCCLGEGGTSFMV